MADSKITALTAISTVDPAADPLVIVDVSDTSMAASGTTKKATINQLLGASGTATLASATISGDLTVDTNTLKVDSANNRVGIKQASPSHPFQIGTTDLILDATGNVGIGVTPSAGGGCLQLKSGITFPATQVASSDANTLDDYEEGTFTATLKGGTTDPTTPVTTTGRYTKIGRQVTVNIYMAGVTTTGASGRIQIDGLPFANSSAADSICAVGFNGMATFTGSTFGVVVPSGTTIYMQSSVSGGAYQAVTFNAGTNQSLWVSLTYNV